MNIHIRNGAHTCQATLGCLRSSIYCVKSEGSNSYLSKAMLSTTIGSQLVHENFTTGCDDRGGCIYRVHNYK